MHFDKRMKFNKSVLWTIIYIIFSIFIHPVRFIIKISEIRLNSTAMLKLDQDHLPYLKYRS